MAPVRRDVAAALRVTVVAVLLLLATLGTAGRRELSWQDLLDPPRDRVASAVLLLLGTVVLAGVARALIEAWRRRARQRRAPHGDSRYLESDPVDRRLAALLAAGALALALAAAVAAGLLIARERGKPKVVSDGSAGGDGGALPGVSAWWAALLLGALVLLAATFVMGVVARRRFRRHPWAGRSADGVGAADQAVSDAVAAAQESLAAHDEVRAGIIAAYEAMVGVLEHRGAHRGPADTAGDLLDRALGASSVPPVAAYDLTALFHEARFSTHPMSLRERRRAESALAEVAASTGERVGARD